MILADRHIRELVKESILGIDPFADINVQPSSLDVRLATSLLEMDVDRYQRIDPTNVPVDLMRPRAMPCVLYPGQFVLASTVEKVRLPDDMAAQLEGKSSLARLGLVVHATAGFIDPGFDGTVTMEMSNVGSLPIELLPGMLIAQIVFHHMLGPAATPYGSPGSSSHYQGQHGPTPAESVR